jgi:putative transposase
MLEYSMSNYKRLYLQNYSYYLTVVTQNRQPILINNIELLRDSFRRSKRKYNYEINAIVILPDHIHMILTPKNPKDYSKIIAHIKRSFSYGLDRQTKENSKFNLSASSYRRNLSGIWQKRFYEHTIRDEDDYNKIINYIYTNPIKHGLVQNIKDWKYSSFV